MNSILQKNKRCLVCLKETDLHLHHIYEGAGRRMQFSDRYGLTVWLCSRHHNMPQGETKMCVHYDSKFDKALKKAAQERAMKHYGWNNEEWIKKCGKSYL